MTNGKRDLHTDGVGVMVVSSTVTSLVRIGAHLDVRNVAGARTELNNVLESAAGDQGDIVIDMAALEVIDATGLGMLTAAHLRAERAGRHLVLRNCSKEIR
ncbi:MAG: STAS domain-containing protein, partial [Nocardioidaceae bacterium]